MLAPHKGVDGLWRFFSIALRKDRQFSQPG